MSRAAHLPWPLALAMVVLLACTDGQSPTGAPDTPASSPAAQTPAPATSSPGEALNVVTSTTVLADLVRQVGGERVTVQALLPAGRDPHTFEPSPGDAALLSAADLLVMNGLGLDEWLEDLSLELADGVPLVVLAEDLEGVEYLAGSDDHRDEGGDEEDDGHGHNPHLWLDVSNARLYVERIAAMLAANDERGRATYESNAAAYDARLAQLDGWIGQQIGALPEENRRVVSLHDAFPYFAHAYAVEIVGVVVESPGQEPTAAEVATLISAIRSADVRAVLAEVQFSDRVAQVIAEETGVSVVSDLYTDSLGDPPLDTYEASMRWNTERIIEGLR